MTQSLKIATIFTSNSTSVDLVLESYTEDDIWKYFRCFAEGSVRLRPGDRMYIKFANLDIIQHLSGIQLESRYGDYRHSTAQTRGSLQINRELANCTIILETCVRFFKEEDRDSPKLETMEGDKSDIGLRRHSSFGKIVSNAFTSLSAPSSPVNHPRVLSSPVISPRLSPRSILRMLSGEDVCTPYAREYEEYGPVFNLSMSHGCLIRKKQHLWQSF